MPLDARPPVPLMEIAIESAAPAHADLLCAALSQLAATDSQVTVRTEWSSGRRLLGGVSEAQLAAKVAELMRDFEDALLIGPPAAVCHETIRRRAEIEYACDEGGSGEAARFARVKILFEPAAPATGFRLLNAVRGVAPPPSFVAAARRGLEAARSLGLVAGFPVTDFWATLVDAEWRDRASDDQAFEAAARGAFAELRTRGAPVSLGPVMVVQLSVPDGLVASVVQELERRGVRPEEIDRTGEQAFISAVAPLAKLFGYGERLRELSLGRASLTMQFAGYAPAEPPDQSAARLPAATARA